MHAFNGFGGGWMMIIWWILILAVVVIAIRWGMTNTSTITKDKTRSKSALEILNERYARGEIDKEEYESRKKDLLR